MFFMKYSTSTIKNLSKQKSTPVSLQEMVQFGQNPLPLTLFKGAQFLKRELPVRLSHRITELENLPLGLSEMPGVITVKNCKEL
jgi:pyruvate dehydrogenase kinase 2/3/4